MSTIVTRSGKGAALTHTEVDANFTNLNADKAEASAVIPAIEKGAASGVCPLDATSKVASTYLPSYVDDVLEYANLAALPVTGETGKIYVALDTNKTYRWSGSAYIYITSGAVDSVAGRTGVVTLTSADVGLGNVTNNAAVANLSGTNTGDQTLPTTLPASDVYAWAKAATKPTYTATEVSLGNASNTSDANKPISTATQTALDLKSPLASPTFTGTVSGITKAMVSLGNVDNTTDANKPVSTATQTALDLKSPLASPTFTGTVNTANLAYTGTLTGGTGVVAIGTNQIYKDASGNVGIGTSSPSTALTVAGAVTITGAFALRGSYGGGAITSNFATGDGALVANTTGGNNTASGMNALANNTTGGANTASGLNALLSNTTGSFNIASGVNALQYNTTGNYNTASGQAALRDNTTGSGNTASGQTALLSNTTGSSNVGIGYGVASSTITVSNEVNIYNGTVTARFQGAAAAWSFVSDARDKSDIEPLTLGLEFITGLQPRKFKWDIRDCDVDKGKEASGFIAQEVLEVVEVCNAGYTGLVDTNNPDQYTVATGNLIPILVNAIKELTARLETLEGKL